MSWKCPECKEEIGSLYYDVNTSGSEYGNAQLNDSPRPATPVEPIPRHLNYHHHYEIITDHDFSDNGDTNWEGDPSYRCPECDADINPNSLIWFDEDEEEEEEKIKEAILEETTHKIISPEEEIIMKDRPINTDSSMICCNKKCFHVFVAEMKGDTHYEEFFIECPKCGEINSSTTYKQLLEAGYFNEIKHDKTRKSPRNRPFKVLDSASYNHKVHSKVQRSKRRKKVNSRKKN